MVDMTPIERTESLSTIYSMIYSMNLFYVYMKNVYFISTNQKLYITLNLIFIIALGC